jgi:CRISPR/Cas system-associated protein endoribonuclease Cas2
VLRKTEKKKIRKKIKTKVLRTGYLIKRFSRYKRFSRKYCGFVLYY